MKRGKSICFSGCLSAASHYSALKLRDLSFRECSSKSFSQALPLRSSDLKNLQKLKKLQKRFILMDL